MHQVHVHSAPPSLVLRHPFAGRSTSESHQRRPAGDVKTHCDISLCPAFCPPGLHSPLALASLRLTRAAAKQSPRCFFPRSRSTFAFRMVEHPRSLLAAGESMDRDTFHRPPVGAVGIRAWGARNLGYVCLVAC